jgi:hypothetical protein
VKKYNKVELEIGRVVEKRQGISSSRPAAVVNIETEDDELLERLVDALSLVEALEG